MELVDCIQLKFSISKPITKYDSFPTKRLFLNSNCRIEFKIGQIAQQAVWLASERQRPYQRPSTKFSRMISSAAFSFTTYHFGLAICSDLFCVIRSWLRVLGSQGLEFLCVSEAFSGTLRNHKVGRPIHPSQSMPHLRNSE